MVTECFTTFWARLLFAVVTHLVLIESGLGCWFIALWAIDRHQKSGSWSTINTQSGQILSPSIRVPSLFSYLASHQSQVTGSIYLLSICFSFFFLAFALAMPFFIVMNYCWDTVFVMPCHTEPTHLLVIY